MDDVRKGGEERERGRKKKRKKEKEGRRGEKGSEIAREGIEGMVYDSTLCTFLHVTERQRKERTQ